MRTFFFTAIASAVLLCSSFMNRGDTKQIYEVSQPIVLKSGDIFDGENRTYSLAPGANCPVFIIGGLESEPTQVVEGVLIKNVIVDGNRGNQTQEIWQNGSNIRNNGITVRKGVNITISNVTVLNCRSGGIVLEKGSSKVSIINSTVENNEFDGIAAYESTNCLISNVTARGNQFAGMSFDLGFNNNLISNCQILDNKREGVFMRSSSFNNFCGLRVSGSKMGIFIAKSELPGSECKNNSFRSAFSGNGKDFLINDVECTGNIFDITK